MTSLPLAISFSVLHRLPLSISTFILPSASALPPIPSNLGAIASTGGNGGGVDVAERVGEAAAEVVVGREREGREGGTTPNAGAEGGGR